MYSVTAALQPKRKRDGSRARQGREPSMTQTERLAAAAGAGFLLVDFAQASLGPHALYGVELPLHAAAQLFGLAVQPAAALARVAAIAGLAIPPLAIARPRPGLPAAIVAVQIAVVIADVADAAAHICEGGPLLASVRSATGRNQRIAAYFGSHAAAHVRTLRQALRRGRLSPRDPGQQKARDRCDNHFHSPFSRLI